MSEFAGVGGTEGWTWGPVGALGEALRWMGQGCRGGRKRGSGESCQGHWRELSADFREAGRCNHGNHRPVTSLKKKKDALGDFCLLPLHPLPGGGVEIWGGGCCESWESGWVDGCQRQEPRAEGVIPPKMAQAPPWGPQGLQALASSAAASPPVLCLRPCLENRGPPWAVILARSHQALQSDQ